MTPITISMIFRIENSVCSGNQRATRSVQIAKPAYNANVVAPRAKEWDMSDDNGSTVFTTNIGAQTSAVVMTQSRKQGLRNDDDERCERGKENKKGKKCGCAGKDLAQVSCTASGPRPVTLSSGRIRMSCCWIDNITPVITNTCTTTTVVDIADTV
ncbi:hypothetical protein BY996DRAFT_6413606 [Phakopsora pachyrhizi]|nr:hypothetical protein BY996DRAFT_6413606 [Phakopsora pachyrhizi]